MPEPGINDPDIDRPTTDRKKFRRRLKARMTLPGEYAEFRLSDGRILREVMGEGTFAPEGANGGKPITDSERQRIRDGNYPLAAILRDESRFAPRPEAVGGPFDSRPATATALSAAAAPDLAAPSKPSKRSGNFEANFVDPPFVVEESDAPDNVLAPSTAGRKPVGVARGLSMAGAHESEDAPEVDPAAIAGMDDSGLSGLADSMLDFDELAALEPETYDDYMRYGKAIGEMVGYSHVEQQRLATVLSGLRGVEANIANAPEGLNGEPSPRQKRRRESERAHAAGFYGAFVTAARARRNIPLDFPRTTSGAIDMSLVQPGFVYKTKDGVLFVVDPGRTKFAEARKLLKPNAGGGLYEPLGSQSPIQLLDERGWPRPAGQVLTEAGGLIRRANKDFIEFRLMNKAARTLSDASRDARKLYGAFKRLDFEAPDSPAANAARDKYLEAWKIVREKEENLRIMLSPETVGARDMMFRAEGRGPYVTHKIPMMQDGQVDARYLEEGKIYEVADGRYFQLDEDGEGFVEMRRLGKPDEHGRAFAPIPDERTSSRTADWAMPDAVSGSVRSEADAIAEHARIVADRAGRGGYLAMVIGTRAREIAETGQLLAGARYVAAKVGIDEKDYPKIAHLEERRRSEMDHLRYLQNKLMEEIQPEAVSIAGMPERADNPGRLENAGNNLVKGGGEVLASIPIFLAVSHSYGIRRLNQYWDEVEGGKELYKFLENPRLNYMSDDFKLISWYYHANEKGRQEYRRRYAYADPRTSELYRLGAGLRDYLEEQLETNPRYADEFFATKLPAALGESLTKSAIVGATTIVGIPAPISGAVLGMMTESSGLFLDALENDMPIDEAYKEFAFGALLGMTEGISIADILGRAATKEVDQRIRTALRDAIINGSEDAAREAVVQIKKIVEEKDLADGEEIAAAFNAEAVKEFALSLIKP